MLMGWKRQRRQWDYFPLSWFDVDFFPSFSFLSIIRFQTTLTNTHSLTHVLPPSLYLLLLLPGQLHLLPLLLQLRGRHLFLLIMGGEELLPQVDQLTNHGGKLVLLLLKRLWRTWTEDYREVEGFSFVVHATMSQLVIFLNGMFDVDNHNSNSKTSPPPHRHCGE